MTQPRLLVRNLSCGRGERALFHDLDFELRGGEAARVRGENGCGKTTLLRTLAGLQAPHAGTVHWQSATPARDGEPVLLQDDLCFVGHENALNGALTPSENLDVLMRLAARRVSVRAIRQVLAELGLDRVAERPCERLSAGQKRRVSLARLWLSEAPLWLLDEPASALDVESRAVLCARIDAHVAGGGIVVFTTHEELTLTHTRVRAIELTPC
ncbi:cytochrome c biogenesis heme-transporting ATPase CcmA [Endozoicomonas sp. G2_2]|uniref:cytochrome c biogenesis heme-transporting ATPase CcmA n=1 Tax=Endozoicomonas sp. G2_2 TaxID=2821092 RepID=UPI001ADC6BB1|nr:cytochrome c biogenesis heme-transporting ATPase CcmA [Endozoicomonas sp. G2_2]MBO9469089.1 cytochrome c biogenesis heme-transporting ATPase CcmA [Endozoicomonas sp. G2_2]